MADKKQFVFRGPLTLERLKELAAEHLKYDKQDDTYNPHKSPYAIAIVRQADGNYVGEVQKDGKVVTARQGDPHTVLEMLITHP